MYKSDRHFALDSEYESRPHQTSKPIRRPSRMLDRHHQTRSKVLLTIVLMVVIIGTPLLVEHFAHLFR